MGIPIHLCEIKENMSEKKISQMPSATVLTGSEVVLIVQNGTTKKVPVSLFQRGDQGPPGPQGPIGPQGTAGANGAFQWNAVPASPSDNGNAGDVAYDSDYFYVAVASNTWKRVLLSTWGA
jgi:hypothetical protein